ncbi:DUF2125 domain-containing protein [Palleronia sp. LCG004]|uniref:DUF2125 domain-containing protein n=1 Tax=Palleronia sp. LCG004 TaxID=3079304 RepID=UPI002942C453|nr:DUF2125 domain-containing protein [Palleronia sp. LCG004]WOI56965.1 DUF2125 domain-containing protein [Palleronia sp. LCG004]
MRKVILVVVAAAIVWSGYWFVGAAALDRGIDAALDELRAEGWRIEAADRGISGFPNRFDTSFDALEIQAPDGDRLTMPFFQILALSYKPNEIIAIFPPEISLDRGGQVVRLTNEDARGSVTFRTSPDLPLDHSAFVIEDLLIESDGIDFSMDELRFATRIPPGAPDARHQNIGLSATGIVLPEQIGRRIEATGLGPIEVLRVDATLDFAAPIDRHALGNQPRIDKIDLHDLALDWGGIGLDGEGLIEIGADGLPMGDIDLTLENVDRAIEVAVAAGLIPGNRAAMITQGLSFLGGSGTEGRVTLPLRFADGDMMLGPIPLGPAPRIGVGR